MMVGRPTFGVARSGRWSSGRPSRPVLRVQGLTARGAHGLDALHDVSFDVAPGEIAGRGRRLGQRPDRARRGALRACAGRPRDRSSSDDVELAGATPQADDGGAGGTHPGGSARQPGAGPVGGRQPDAGARRRLPVRRPAGPAAHRGARQGPHRAIRHQGAAGGPGRHAVGRQHPEGAAGAGAVARPAGHRRLAADPRPGRRAPPSTCAASCSRAGPPAPPSCSCRRTWTSCWRCPTDSSCSTRAASWAQMSATDADPERLGMLMAGRGLAA